MKTAVPWKLLSASFQVKSFPVKYYMDCKVRLSYGWRATGETALPDELFPHAG